MSGLEGRSVDWQGGAHLSDPKLNGGVSVECANGVQGGIPKISIELKVNAVISDLELNCNVNKPPPKERWMLPPGKKLSDFCWIKFPESVQRKRRLGKGRALFAWVPRDTTTEWMLELGRRLGCRT